MPNTPGRSECKSPIDAGGARTHTPRTSLPVMREHTTRASLVVCCTFDAKDIISVGGGVRLLTAGIFRQHYILVFALFHAKILSAILCDPVCWRA